MNFHDKTQQLQARVFEALLPRVNREFWFLEIPYYSNVGDTLIWEGTRAFLRRCAGRRGYETSRETFVPRAVTGDTLILLQGGGGLGDLWGGQPFRRRIIQEYPHNEIIILPQTVFYNDPETLRADAGLFNRHPRLTICARDLPSYETLRNNFNAEILLVPDMAFCIDTAWLKKRARAGRQAEGADNALFLKRTDKELNQRIDYARHIRERNVETHDWPVMEKTAATQRLLSLMTALRRKTGLPPAAVIDAYARLVFKNDLIQRGARFISSYAAVYTTRLHGAIMCCLLKKPFVLFNNSYGKNRGFYETWLSDVEGITFYDE